MRTILVVEDEPIIRSIAVEILEEAGCSVIEFSTADEAVAYCQGPTSDVAAIFTDINMQGDLDGLDLAMVAAKAHPHALVIVTSGRYQSKPADLGLHVRFLPKPWTERDLLQVLSGVI